MKVFIVVKLTECVNESGDFCYNSENVATFGSSTGAQKKLAEIEHSLKKNGHVISNYDNTILDETENVTFSIEHA